MANFDLKSPGVQKFLLAVLLAGGALGVYFFTHLLPWTFPKGGEHIAELEVDRDRLALGLLLARQEIDADHRLSP